MAHERLHRQPGRSRLDRHALGQSFLQVEGQLVLLPSCQAVQLESDAPMERVRGPDRLGFLLADEGVVHQILQVAGREAAS
jgi:hypothetical protein